MLSRFDVFLHRHGECATQALLENWEKHFHAPPSQDMSLRDRWQRMEGFEPRLLKAA